MKRSSTLSLGLTALLACVLAGLAARGQSFAIHAEHLHAAEQDDGKSREELARETAAYCAKTAAKADELTPRRVMETVDRFVALLEEEGLAAFARLHGKDSDFIFCGTYLWVHDMEGVVHSHPLQPELEGRFVYNLRDRTGKPFFWEMSAKVKEKGAGWVEYVWPRPGGDELTSKVSYVKRAAYGETVFIVGCGIYGKSLEDVRRILANDGPAPAPAR